MPGVLAFIKSLQDKLELGLVTNSTRKETNILLKTHDLQKTFQHTMSGDETCCPKPAPDLYQTLVRCFKTSPEACVAFEDSQSGVASAQQSGVLTIAVPNKYTRNQSFRIADCITKSWNNLSLKKLQVLAARKTAKKVSAC